MLTARAAAASCVAPFSRGSAHKLEPSVLCRGGAGRIGSQHEPHERVVSPTLRLKCYLVKISISVGK